MYILCKESKAINASKEKSFIHFFFFLSLLYYFTTKEKASIVRQLMYVMNILKFTDKISNYKNKFHAGNSEYILRVNIFKYIFHSS